MSSVKFSELGTVVQLQDVDILPISVVDTTATPNTYTSYKTTVLQLGGRIVAGTQFTNNLLTKDKTICGAINEVRGFIFIDILEAGETSLTIQDGNAGTPEDPHRITTNSTVEVWENVGAYSDAVMYSDIVVTTGQIVITFPAQSTDLQVKVRVS